MFGLLQALFPQLLLILFSSPLALAAVDIRVNPAVVIKTNTQVPLGMGLNQLNDGTLSLESLKSAVLQTGSKHLRFPEGESADNYSFTDPAFLNRPNPSTARMVNPKYWPVGTSLANHNGTLRKGLNFDQFMTVARAAGASPNIVLCYPCGDKVKALEIAKAWVKYSKDKAYNVLNWEIGNETYLYHPNYTDEYPMTADEYARDIVTWAVALKSIDPRIRIGVNGKTRAWLKTLMTYKDSARNLYGAQVIDFLAIHSYPMYDSSFSAYQQNRNAWGALDFTADLHPAMEALWDAADVVNTAHIKISVTECSTMNFSTQSDPNNMGSALMTADLLLTLLKQPRVDFVELWASRWIKNFSSGLPQGSDTFSAKNKLNPSGLALAAITQFNREQVVATTGETSSLKAFASRSQEGALTVVLLNRANSVQGVSLSVVGAESLSGKKHSFQAGSATSTTPTFDATGVAVQSSLSALNLSVPKTSFLILNFPKLK